MGWTRRAVSLASDKKSPLHDDEEIEASRAPLLDHLAELRDRLMRVLLCVVVGVVICFFFADKLFLFLVQPFQSAMAALDPHTNILRATAAVFGAGLGGADSISVLPFSLAQGLPNAFARRVARNVQTVLMEEAGLWRVADPASGAGYGRTPPVLWVPSRPEVSSRLNLSNDFSARGI